MREDGVRKSLIIADAGLPGLVVSALATLEGATPVWALPTDGTRRRTATKDQSAASGAAMIEIDPRAAARSRGAALASAWLAAVEHGCDRVVLPDLGEECENDIDSAIAEATSLIARRGHVREPHFATPLIGLSIEQVAELAFDLELSAGLCWWSERYDHLCDTLDPIDERWRWEAALAAGEPVRGA